jgi:hypothetical protein
LLVGFTVVLALPIMAIMLRHDGSIPAMSTCSAAISAACHRFEGDDDVCLFPVKWGTLEDTVEGNNVVGHCSFTTARDVYNPLVEHLYS